MSVRRSHVIRNFAAALFTVTLLGTSASGAFAQQSHWSWPEKPKNLKVLPKDAKGEKLAAIMIGYTRALGVRCTYCHVGEEGKPLDTYDFPSDQNPKKNIARGMVKMLGKINKELVSIQPAKAERVNMWCQTCHHGRPLPMTLAEELTRVYAMAGPDTVAVKYRSLRDRFYGGASYDFRERSLLEVADAALAKKDPRGAIAILNVDAEFYPNSGAVQAGLGEAYLAAADTVQAIAAYEKAVTLEPRNQDAKRALEELRKGR